VTRVAFVGLGVMGRPMAENLLAAGHELVVANRSPGPVEALEARGARGAATPAEAAREAEAVITMVPDDAAVLAVMEGDDGIFAGAAPGTLVIEMSTISPATAVGLAERGAERGLELLDAPVSGGDVGARAGTLAIMAGGEPAAFERARPLFDVLGSAATLVGGSGSGQVVKACNQIVVALTIEAVAEALTLGEAAGVEPATVLDVLGGGLAANRVMEARRDNLLDHRFQPGFRVDLHRKDLGIALAAAEKLGVELPATPIVQGLFERLSAAGRGAEDHTALLAAVEQLRR
jgi:2-hydroxy-3-oxopropionate reductase